MTSKRTVMLVGLIAVALLGVASTRTWVNASLADAVLQQAHLAVNGSGAAPTCVAAAFVGAAGIIAALTTGPIARWVAAALVLLSGVLALVGVILLIQDPQGAIRGRVGSATGRIGNVAATTSLTVWVWVALVGAVALTAAGVLTLAGVRRWSGLSSSYETPRAARARKVSDWDRLSAGDDPTRDGSDDD